MVKITKYNVIAFEAFLDGYVEFDQFTPLDKVGFDIRSSGSDLIAPWGEEISEGIIRQTFLIALMDGRCPTVIEYCKKYDIDIEDKIREAIRVIEQAWIQYYWAPNSDGIARCAMRSYNRLMKFYEVR